MKTFFARQPILDPGQRLYGYELLFRADPEAKTAGKMVQHDGDRATATVLEALFNRGIDNVTGNKKAFVNFTEGLLRGNIFMQYPPEDLVVEVLETVKLNDDLYDALALLKEKGYQIALDDYVSHCGNERILELVDIVKVEVNDTTKMARNINAVRTCIDPSSTKILAEKVETREVFETARRLGCTLFQGYYFAYPDIVVDHTLGAHKVNHLRLVAEVSKPNVDFAAVAQIIKQDVALSYKTLRLVNSAYFGLPQNIPNIQQALVFLGTNELKKWIAFTAMTNITEGKPSELVTMSLTRGYFCEMVANNTRRQGDAESYFLAGMFSLLDVMLEVKMETALNELSLTSVTRAALLEEDNPGWHALQLIRAFERGQWERASNWCEKLSLHEDTASEIYLRAISWGGSPMDNVAE